jgi:hypothetical protein
VHEAAGGVRVTCHLRALLHREQSLLQRGAPAQGCKQQAGRAQGAGQGDSGMLSSLEEA